MTEETLAERDAYRSRRTTSRSMVGLSRHLTTLPLIWAGKKNVSRGNFLWGL